MSWVPTFKLYDSTNSSLVYQVENVLSINWPQDNPDVVEITNLRSQGGIIIPGGDKPWDLIIEAILISDSYTNLTTAIFNLKSTIASNTRYVLRADKSQSTYDTINVMRIEPIVFDFNSKRFNNCRFTLTLRANSWA